MEKQKLEKLWGGKVYHPEYVERACEETLENSFKLLFPYLEDDSKKLRALVRNLKTSTSPICWQ